MYAKVLLIEFPKREQFFDNSLLLVPRCQLRDKARVFEHGVEVEVGAEAVTHGEEGIGN
jgi:hypothetical protein